MCNYGCEVSALSEGPGTGLKTAVSCALAGRFFEFVVWAEQMFDRLEELWKT
jgi:hypothetical protein